MSYFCLDENEITIRIILMKSWLMLSIAVLLTALSFQVSHPEVDFIISENDMIKTIPGWDLLPTQSPNSKGDFKVIFKTQNDFVNEVFITELTEHITPVYYLPIYRLHREKEYFLLI